MRPCDRLRINKRVGDEEQLQIYLGLMTYIRYICLVVHSAKEKFHGNSRQGNCAIKYYF